MLQRKETLGEDNEYMLSLDDNMSMHSFSGDIDILKNQNDMKIEDDRFSNSDGIGGGSEMLGSRNCSINYDKID